MTTAICQIVPELPPAINGLGDYALNLARQLRQDYQIDTHFLVGNPSWQGDESIEGFKISQLEKRHGDNLFDRLSLISPQKILLHYVGYGYAQRGCPIWLIDGLKQIKQKASPQLITMFHEVCASSPYPWHSSYWLFPFQKSIASQLSHITDSFFTSKQFYAEILIKISKNKHTDIKVMPVFSNIGEPLVLPLDLSSRHRHLIIFGSTGRRIKVYENCVAIIAKICQQLNIEKIIDIGDFTDKIPANINNIYIVKTGKLPSKEISKIMGNSLVGFSNYHPNFLAKSTIFAAYCAHRLLPINFQGNISGVDGIKANTHYLSEESDIEEKKIQSIADNAYYWYMEHNIKNQARQFHQS